MVKEVRVKKGRILIFENLERKKSERVKRSARVAILD